MVAVSAAAVATARFRLLPWCGGAGSVGGRGGGGDGAMLVVADDSTSHDRLDKSRVAAVSHPIGRTDTRCCARATSSEGPRDAGRDYGPPYYYDYYIFFFYKITEDGIIFI